MDPHTGEWVPVLVDDRDRPSFEIQKQPSAFSCLPTSFAMVMSMDAAAIVKKIGHDDERGFHVQELLCIALGAGWAFTPFEMNPQVEPVTCCSEALTAHAVSEGEVTHVFCPSCGPSSIWRLEPKVLSFESLLQRHNGVLTGRSRAKGDLHAVAWCSKIRKCLDPRGMVCGIEEFDPDTFWLATRIKE